MLSMLQIICTIVSCAQITLHDYSMRPALLFYQPYDRPRMRSLASVFPPLFRRLQYLENARRVKHATNTHGYNHAGGPTTFDTQV
jgi:hypothetical protein